MGGLLPQLPDVGIGALTRWCPPELVDAAIDKHHRREERRRLLPARTMVYFELARCLCPGQGWESVYEHLLPEGVGPSAAGCVVPVPNKSSLCKARRRVGEDVLREVFVQVAGPVAEVVRCPSAFWRGLRLLSFDGTVLDVADTPANAQEFTRPPCGGGVGGYPQVKVVVLAECGTHALVDAVIGDRGQGDATLAMHLAAAAGAGTLVLGDRGMPGVRLWNAFRQAGAHLLWRLKHDVAAKPEQVLPDGTYLARMRPDRSLEAKARRGGRPARPVLLRVIEYTVDGSGEIYRLGTSLTDPQGAPACELAMLYSERWDSEGVLAEVKTAQRGPGAVLGSGRPDGVRQQIWAHLTVHHLTRVLMYHAATSGEKPADPGRMSFRRAQRLIRRDLSPALFPS